MRPTSGVLSIYLSLHEILICKPRMMTVREDAARQENKDFSSMPSIVALVTVGSAAEVGDSIGIGTQGQSTNSH